LSAGQGQFLPVYFRDTQSVPAGQTKTIHDINLDDMRSIDYKLTFFNTTENKTKAMQLKVIKATDLTWIIFQKMGFMNVEILPKEVAGLFTLDIKNNESHSIDIEFGFAPLGEV